MIDNNVFLNGILEQINNIVTDEQLRQIKVKLSAYIDDYAIEQKNYSVAIRESIPQAYKHFLVSKKIEGLSDKTLGTYSLQRVTFHTHCKLCRTFTALYFES